MGKQAKGLCVLALLFALTAVAGQIGTARATANDGYWKLTGVEFNPGNQDSELWTVELTPTSLDAEVLFPGNPGLDNDDVVLTWNVTWDALPERLEPGETFTRRVTVSGQGSGPGTVLGSYSSLWQGQSVSIGLNCLTPETGGAPVCATVSQPFDDPTYEYQPGQASAVIEFAPGPVGSDFEFGTSALNCSTECVTVWKYEWVDGGIVDDGASPPSGNKNGGVPVVPVAAAAAAAAAAAVGVQRRRRRSGRSTEPTTPEPAAEPSAESPECQQVGADRARLEERLLDFEQQQADISRKATQLDDDRQTIQNLQRRISAMSRPPSSLPSAGFFSTESTIFGTQLAAAQQLAASIGNSRLGALAGRAGTVVGKVGAVVGKVGDVAGNVAGVVGAATGVRDHDSRLSGAASLRELRRLQARLDLLERGVADRSQHLSEMAAALSGSRGALENEIGNMNSAGDRFNCASPPLDAARLSPKPRQARPARRDDWQLPPLESEDDARCDDLASEIADYNRRVQEATPQHEHRLERAADLGGKIEALDRLGSELGRRWLDLTRQIEEEWSNWEDGMFVSHVINFGGLATALISGPLVGFGLGATSLASAEFAAGSPSDAILALRGRYEGYQDRIRTNTNRLRRQAGENFDDRMRVAEPLRVEGNSLGARRKRCFHYLSGQTTSLPAIERLTQRDPTPNHWERADQHGTNGVRSPLTAKQIITLLRKAETW